MREGRWVAGDPGAGQPPAQPSPTASSYREGMGHGRVDALAEVLRILDGVLAAPETFPDAYREIRALHAGAALRAGE